MPSHPKTKPFLARYRPHAFATIAFFLFLAATALENDDGRRMLLAALSAAAGLAAMALFTMETQAYCKRNWK